MVTTALAAIVGVDAKVDAVKSNANNIAEDIKKFKELLDGGIKKNIMRRKNNYWGFRRKE